MKKNVISSRNNVIDFSKFVAKKSLFSSKSVEDFYKEDFEIAKIEILDSLKKEQFIFSWEMIKQLFYYEKNVAFKLNYQKGDKIFNQNNGESKYSNSSTFCFAIYNLINLFTEKKLKERNVTREINNYLDEHSVAAKYGMDFKEQIDFVTGLKKEIFFSLFNTVDDVMQLLKNDSVFTTCIKIDKNIIVTTISGYITNGKDCYLEVLNTGEEIPIYIELNFFFNAYKRLDNLMFEELRRNLVYQVSKKNEIEHPCYVVMSKVGENLDIRNSPIDFETKKVQFLNTTGYSIEFIRSQETLLDAKKENFGIFPIKKDTKNKKFYISLYKDAIYTII